MVQYCVLARYFLKLWHIFDEKKWYEYCTDKNLAAHISEINLECFFRVTLLSSSLSICSTIQLVHTNTLTYILVVNLAI